MYSCLTTFKAGNGLILWYQVSRTKGAAAAPPSLLKLGDRLEEGLGMHTVYTDQCCTDRVTIYASVSLSPQDRHTAIKSFASTG